MIYFPFLGRGQPGGNYPRVFRSLLCVNHKKNRAGFPDCLITLLGFGAVIVPTLYAKRIVEDVSRRHKMDVTNFYFNISTFEFFKNA
jgi:hypothetical protein